MSTLCKGVMVTWILRLSLFTPDRKLLLTWGKRIKYFLCFHSYLLVIELVEAEQVIKADNLVILKHL